MSNEWTCIKIASSPQELLDLYQFRYGIYVEEMQRPQADANHDRKMIEDSLDRSAHNLIALNDQTIVGAFRVNLEQSGSLGIYEDFYEIRRHSRGSRSNAIATRFMVSKAYRRTDLAVALCVAAFELGLANEVDHCFMDCNDHLVTFFLRLGFEEYAAPAAHKEYGLVHRMRLAIRDSEHLRAADSPFAAALARHQTATQTHPQETRHKCARL